ETGLLALDDAGVTREEAGLLEGRTVVLSVDVVQCAGDAETQRAGLARVAATRDAGDDVVCTDQGQRGERGVDQLLVQLVREVVLEGTTVDRDGARAGDQAHAGDGLLATAHGSARHGEHGTGGRGLGGRGLRGRGREALGEFCGVLNVSDEYVLSLGGAYWATWSRVYGVGCCAACGCSAPAYTFSFDSCSRPRVFFGSMPRTAFSTARTGFFSRSSA